MSVTDQTDLEKVVEAVSVQLADGWVRWPGGYPVEIELALIDAIFSIQAKYGKPENASTAASGVQAVVGRWRAYRGEIADDLAVIAGLDEAEFLAICGNKTQTSGRTKASAVQEAARRFLEVGVRSAADFAPHQSEAKRAYVSVHGLAGVTFSYLRMLLGLPDVKADTWIMRFIAGALGRAPEKGEASRLMHEAANAFAGIDNTTMPTTPTDLDHAIWYAQSQRLAQ